MNKPLQHAGAAGAHRSGETHRTDTGNEQKLNPCGKLRAAPDAKPRFPRRPDPDVLSESITLFYIGRNKHGFWLAREAEGRSGGLFLLKRSAVSFASKNSQSAGCATMFLNEPFELDIDNQGNRLLTPLSAAMDIVSRRAPLLSTFVAMAVGEWRTLVAQVSRAFAGKRKHREAIKQDLFHGQYTLSSKNDDDLPIVP